MNCRESQSQLYAGGSGTPDDPARADLAPHLEGCAACRRVRDDLAATLSTWRTETAQLAVPEAEREWHNIRRRIHGGDAATIAGSGRRRSWLAWLTLPLGAAAAAAIAVFVSLPPERPQPVTVAVPALTARADFVEAPGHNASTMVFVDDQSGWLIVWASDAVPQQG